LRSIKNKQGEFEDIKILEDLCYQMSPGNTFCAHAPGAISPLQSALKYFRIEFESGIKNRNLDNFKKVSIF